MSERSGPKRGRVLGIALRSRSRGPMNEVREASAAANGWLAGDHGGSPRRGITFLSREAWAEATDAVGVSLPWHTRRANVCVTGLDLLPLVGRRIRVGEIEVEILDETRPCDEMDAAHPGLQAALRPAGRGGVYGRVRVGGTVSVGDTIEVLPAHAG